jgi:Na+:H+ antiporter, NhaA family
LVLAPFSRFMKFEASGGIALIVMAAVAMIWANSAGADSYFNLFLKTKVTVGFGDWALSKALILWINDLLMALFFLLVGLEIKREVLRGELNSMRKASVPIAAAIGGMLVPGLLFAAINWGEPTIRGWGIPMATDIAFALGVLALAGRRVPLALGVFLTTLAIVDDLGALVIIAVFYTEQIGLSYLGYAGLCLIALIVLNVLGFRKPLPYLLVGIVLWYFVLKSGVHATIAGVVVALTIPSSTRVDQNLYAGFIRRMLDRFSGQIETLGPGVTTPDQQSVVLAIEKAGREVETPLRRLESALLPWCAFLILPVFALANAGVALDFGGEESVMPMRVLIGVAVGLLIGKPIGVFAATWICVKLGFGELPKGVGWRHIHGAAWLAGIGFTMALFIANLGYAGDSQALDAAKLGVLGASVLAGVVGWGLLMTGPKISPDEDHHD